MQTELYVSYSQSLTFTVEWDIIKKKKWFPVFNAELFFYRTKNEL